MIRLESLKADEEKRRTMIGTLEQRQHNLDEGIRLDLVAAGQREQAARDEESQATRLKQLSDEEQEIGEYSTNSSHKRSSNNAS